VKLMNRYTTLSILYLTQTLPMAFIATALPVLIRNQQWSLTMVASVQILALPWSIKFLWAPWVDRYTLPLGKGKRCSWMLSLQCGILLVVLSLGLSDWSIHAAILILILIFFCATHDIALDAWAVENLRPEQRPIANSIQIGAIHAAKLIGGSVLLYLFVLNGFEGILIVFAIAALLSIATIMRTQENTELFQADSTTFEIENKSIDFKNYLNEFRGFFQIPGIRLWLLGLIGFRVGGVVFLILVRPWLVDLGWSLSKIAALYGWALASSALAACGLSALCIKRLGSKHCFAIAAFGLLLTIVAFPLAVFIKAAPWVLGTLLCSFSFFESVCLVIFFSNFMKKCRAGHAGTDFTFQQCIYALTLQLGIFAGIFADRFGYTPVIYVCAIFLLISIPIVAYSLEGKIQKTGMRKKPQWVNRYL
jgi:MFS family permease